MATAAELSRRFRRIELKDLQRELAQIIVQQPQPLVQEKVKELRKGENPDGDRIGFYRSRQYSLFKRAYNPLASGTVDLILTGSFSRGLFIESRGGGLFNFDSRDSKTPDLIAKYGTEWQGLNDKTLREVEIEYYAPKLRSYVINLIRK